MSKNKRTDIAVCIRSSGERTEELCLQLIEKQIPKENISIVKDVRPFQEASALSIKKCIDKNLKYTALIDADLLILNNSLLELASIFDNLKDDYFYIDTMRLDKFFFAGRQGGIHFYRTELLKKHEEINQQLQNTDRPEARFHQLMVDNGFKIFSHKEVTSLHEFGQSYQHIFKKQAFRLVKYKTIKLKHQGYLRFLGIFNIQYKVAALTADYLPKDAKNMLCDIINFDEQWAKMKMDLELNEQKSQSPNAFITKLLFSKTAAYSYIYVNIPFKLFFGNG